MIVRELKDKARESIANLYGQEVRDFRLEQLEQETDGQWFVVVSFLVDNVNTIELKGFSALSNAFPSALPFERVFKTLVFSEDGELKKVLIYNK